MYRNCHYNPFDQEITLRTWDDSGKRIDVKTSFSPYLYLETSEDESEALSLFKTPLKKKIFRSSFERSKYVERLGENPRIFHSFAPEQQYLIDTFRTVNNTQDFAKHPLYVAYLDIETYSPGAFPVPQRAADPVNLITIYNSLTQTFHTWGLERDYKPNSDNTVYYCCKNEVSLFERFMDYWTSDYPDILSGWSSEFFDIPYIIYRMTKLLGEEATSRLSPVNNIRSRKVLNDFGKETEKWTISGVSCLDYLNLYKTFSIGERGSYKLNDIAEAELGEGKVAFGATSLSQLSETDWNTFVDYNIQDVNLLVKLEEKLKYLQISRLLAYKGCTNFEAALGKVAIVTGAVAVEALNSGYVMPTFGGRNEREAYDGGYVKDPEKGFQRAMVTFDVNSLYPNTIVTLNISPETKVGKVYGCNDLRFITSDSVTDEVTLQLVNGKTHKLTLKELKALIKAKNLSISKAGVLYNQNTKGIVPSLIEKIYAERVAAKNQMIELKKELAKINNEIQNI